MPFTKCQPEDRSDLRDLASGWGKIVTRRAFGDAGPGLDRDCDAIEALAVDRAQALTRGTIEEILRIPFQRLGDHQPCPACARPCPVPNAPRTLAVRGGTATSDEPVCHCPACRRDCFPPAADCAARLAQLLAGDPREDPPGRRPGRVVPRGSVADRAEVALRDRQVGRIAHDVGERLRQARAQQVDDFQGRRLVPGTTVAPKLAVVSVDGGRFPTRTEGQGPGVHAPAGREDKVAALVTMSTRSPDPDPHPELPRCFTQKEAVVELVPGIPSQGALADGIDPTAETILQVRAAQLSEDDRLAEQLKTRPISPFRQYKATKRRKAG